MAYITDSFLNLKTDETIRDNPYPLSLVVKNDKRGLNISVRQTTPFKPYVDPYIDMAHDPYKDDIYDDIEDFIIDSFVNKLLTNQAVSLAEGKEYFEDYENTFYDEEKVPEMYKIRSNNGFYLNDKPLPKKKAQNIKRGRKKKSKADEIQQHVTSAYGEFPVGSEQFVRPDGTQMITMSVNMIRQYMHTEVEVRVRHVNEYYKRQWNHVNRERMQALADLIKSQETTRSLKAEMESMTALLDKYKIMCSTLDSQVSVSREAKRRRRQAKKQRKTESTRDGNDGNENTTDRPTSDSDQIDVMEVNRIDTDDRNNNGPTGETK